MLTDAKLAELRAEFNDRMMRSAVSEYCPNEFGDLLDEIDRLKRRQRNGTTDIDALA